MMDPTEQDGLLRMRLEMVAAREAMGASMRWIAAASANFQKGASGPSEMELTVHRALCDREENATTIYLQCLHALADRAQEEAARVSRPAPLL